MRIFRILFLHFVVLLSCSNLFAQHFKVGDIWYDILSFEDKTVAVTSLGYVNEEPATDHYKGSVIIPKSITYEGDIYFVKCIEPHAFYECPNLTSVVIPNSVTRIEYDAFSGCSGLTSVVIPNSVTSVSARAFKGCTSLISVKISERVTSVCDRTFEGCTSLTSVKIPESVDSIGEEAFARCSSLTTVEIPNSMTYIGRKAFEETPWYNNIKTDGLVYIKNVLYDYNGVMPEGTSIKIKEGTVAISPSVFKDCTDLTSVDIPSSVISIGEDVFARCSSLTSVTIPNSVTSIGKSAFYGCSGLTSVVIPNSVVEIGNSAFEGCSSLTSVMIPKSVVSIGMSAFEGCTNLSSVHISNIVSWCNIDFKAPYSNPLYYSKRLCINGEYVKDLVIPEGVKSIGARAFEGCSSLTSVKIPESVDSIGVEAFQGCTSLVSVHISNISSWCNIDFEDSYSNPLYYSKRLCINGEYVKDLVIPEGVKSIGARAFDGCLSLTSVKIPKSVDSIGMKAFHDCSGLASMEIHDNVIFIGNEAFDGTPWYDNIKTDGLVYIKNVLYKYNGVMPENTSIKIKEGTVSISSMAFEDCIGLISVTIPNSVVSIGDDAFSGCHNLTSVHISDIASWCNIDFKNPGSNPLCNHVSLCINGKPIRHLTISNGVEKIGDNAFHSCSSLVSVKIGNSVKHIGEMVFIGCENLTSVKIGDSVETISSSAFVGSHIKTIELGKNLKNIGDMVFEFCNINTVVCHAEEPPLVEYNNLYAKIPKLYVPKHSIRKYKLTEAWGGCEKILPIK